MRVIAGAARGIRLTAPKGQDVRPTLDRVRESLFNILAPRLDGARFLDLFAGTAANGIEALSRGAAWATFVDNAASSRVIIQQNLTHTKFDTQADILPYALPAQLDRIPQTHAPYTIIFADPPYAFTGYETLLTGIGECKLLTPEGVIIIEHAQRNPMAESAGIFQRVRQTTYGDTVLSFFTTIG